MKHWIIKTKSGIGNKEHRLPAGHDIDDSKALTVAMDLIEAWWDDARPGDRITLTMELSDD